MSIAISNIPFVDFHCHSAFSPLDGLDTPDELVKRAKEIGLTALSITDHGTSVAHREMIKAGIKHDFPIILGVEAYFSGSDDRFDRRSKAKRQDGEDIYNHIILIAKNDRGLRNLNRMMSKAWNESYYNKPMIDFELLSEYGEDIIVSSACVSGLIARNLINGNPEKAYWWAKRFKNRFGDDFVIELQTHNDDFSPWLNQRLLNMADYLGIKAIVTTDTHFAREEDRWIEDALLILNTNPKKIETIDYDHMAKLDFMDKYNYLYPDRSMSFEKIDLFLQNGLTLHQQFLKHGIDRTDLITNTIDLFERMG